MQYIYIPNLKKHGNDERSRGYGGAESERSDGMGWISEQPESVDRGTAPERTDLHLTDNTVHEAVSEDNSDTAFSVLEEAKSRISEYIDKEFGNEADFSDLSNVSLAFTTDEDSFTPIEVYADLVEYRIVTLYDDKDVAQILGYRDTSDALKKHVDDDKLSRRFADSGQNHIMYIINESGLYTESS